MTDPFVAPCTAGHRVWVDISDPDRPAVAHANGPWSAWVECEKDGAPCAPFCPRCGGAIRYEAQLGTDGTR